MDKLSKHPDATFVKLYWGEGLTLDEIGQRLGVTGAAVGAAMSRRNIVKRSQGPSNTGTLKASDVIKIRKMLKLEIPGAIIARKYGVSRQAIWAIKHGKTWRNVGK